MRLISSLCTLALQRNLWEEVEEPSFYQQQSHHSHWLFRAAGLWKVMTAIYCSHFFFLN